MRRWAFHIWLSSLLYIMAANQAMANAAPAESRLSDAASCHGLIARAEAEMNIPRHLLQAVALTESGRTVTVNQGTDNKKAFTAWPWTVMAEGRGRYLPNKQAAIAEVRKLQKNGVRNIDVGCMQVNLHYHGKAFASLEQAFDPVHNVAYAAAFLSKLREDRRSWTMAVKYYHSSNRERQSYYRNKVFTTWRKLQRDSRFAALDATGKQAPGWATTVTGQPFLRNGYQAQKRMETRARMKVLSPGIGE